MRLWIILPWPAWAWELHLSVPQGGKLQNPHSLPQTPAFGGLGADFPTKAMAGLHFGHLFVLPLQLSCQDAKKKLVWMDTKYISCVCGESLKEFLFD